ncbi:hypothetical protein H2204_013190 [Knufia peltigerae]|uniref:Asp/Glu racemase n=1 Tax=Knufia peltigerae TaxID=1002370 RepID=A0AA38XQZ4_9EURO|nr:hypothetical protein H2204_013190 [Knufia peltigerae]
MVRKIRLGVIVPSSNTTLEPLTSAMVSSIDDPGLDVSVHYSRFRVTTIDVSRDADAQFQLEPMLAAARLLADAEVDVIGWSGTSSGWLGFDRDEALCGAIRDATGGIPATSSVLAMNRILEGIRRGRRHGDGDEKGEGRGVTVKVGLVTPYVSALNDAIRSNYSSIGYEITPARERHLGMTKNTDFADIAESTLDGMVEGVVEEGGADVVAIFCTNLAGARRAAHWEEQQQQQQQHRRIVVLDSVATTVWGMLRTIDVDPACVKGWGSIFSTPYDTHNAH